MTTLDQIFESLSPEEKNRLTEQHLGHQIAKVVHQFFHSIGGNPELEFEKIKNSELFKNLPPESNEKVLQKFDKARELIAYKNKQDQMDD